MACQAAQGLHLIVVAKTKIGPPCWLGMVNLDYIAKDLPPPDRVVIDFTIYAKVFTQINL
jgi:hypothetical protein